MSTGQFINFYLPYTASSTQAEANAGANTQATAILTKAQALITGGANGVAITYSANYNQTVAITQTYAAGGWNTQTQGANQALVMAYMEGIMAADPTYQSLQGKLHILPVTTMNGVFHPVANWNDDFQMSVVVTDLARVDTYLNNGWDVLAWQNQKTVNNATAPYAIGGGIATTISPAINATIQQALIGFAQRY